MRLGGFVPLSYRPGGRLLGDFAGPAGGASGGEHRDGRR